MQLKTVFLAAILSAGALSHPTTDEPLATLEKRSNWAYIGMYDNKWCKGNGIKNGKRPKIKSRKCVKFVHNPQMNGTFPFVKINFGDWPLGVDKLKAFTDTNCKNPAGQGTFTPPAGFNPQNWVCVDPKDFGDANWGSVRAVD